MIYFIFFNLLLLFISIKYVKKVLYFRKRGFPSITPLPFFGLDTFFENPLKTNLENRQKYGPVYGRFFSTLPIIIVSDPDIVKQITIKEFHNFTDANAFKLKLKYFQNAFLLKKGKEWKNGRAIVSPVFTSKKIKEIFSQFQKASKPLFLNIESMMEDGKQNEINIKELLKNYGLDVIAKFVYAIDINSAKEKDHPFVKNVHKLASFSTSIRKLFLNLAITFLPKSVITFFDLQFFDMKAAEYLANLTRTIIKQRKANKDENYNDFIELLLHTIDEKGLSVPDEEIIGTCIIFFFAGLETVSTTISNAFYTLALYPEYQDKLFLELIDLYPSKEINYDNIKESPLLDAILKESQRKYPALNMTFRVAENSIEIKGKDRTVIFEANDVIGIDIFSLHNDPDFWEQAELFRPERFLEKDIKYEGDDLFKPFGSGPRSCVAARMALMQVKYIIAQIILNYNVYRTEKTDIPPKYMLNPQQMTYSTMNLGFKKR